VIANQAPPPLNKGALLIVLGVVLSVIFLMTPTQAYSLGRSVLQSGPVAMFALYALFHPKGGRGRTLAVILALGAVGDFAIGQKFELGAAAFAVGHVIAIRYYWRNRRYNPAPLVYGLMSLFMVAVVTTAEWLASGKTTAIGLGVYTLLVSGMAATALLSRFPRDVTGLGAVTFLCSDLLIFAAMGPLAQTQWVGPAIWMTYIAGQLLICCGVCGVLDRDEQRNTDIR